MKLGIFTKTFPRPTFRDTLAAVRALGIRHLQLNSLPSSLTNQQTQLALTECGLRAEVLSATFNIIHPVLERREEGFNRYTVLAAAARQLGIGILSVSTGTRDPADMWRAHPANHSAEAWQDMLHGMARLCRIAEEHNVRIAFEPEQANVVDTAQKARALLDTLQSKHLGVLMDAANLLTVGNLPRQASVLKEAFELLGEEILAAHAKEFSADGTLGQVGLGKGAVDFELYLSLLQRLPAPIPLIMHGFDESEAESSLHFLQQQNLAHKGGD